MNRRNCVAWLVVLTISTATAARQSVAQFTENDRSRIFQLDAAGEHLVCLDNARLPGYKWCGSPQFSADGSRLAFDATPHFGDWNESRIAVYHLHGPQAGTTVDLGLGNGPSWSPDGKMLAFFMNPSPHTGLWIMYADGTSRERIGAGCRPSWSPDGRYVAACYAGSPRSTFFLLDVVSGEIVELLDGQLQGVGSFCWSPHGDYGTVVRLDEAGRYQIVLLKRDEQFQQAHVIWQAGHDSLPPDADPFQPVWHPNGRQLLVRFGSASQRWGWGRYFQMPLPAAIAAEAEPAGTLQPFGHTNAPIYRADACWAPDGKSVVFTQDLEE